MGSLGHSSPQQAAFPGYAPTGGSPGQDAANNASWMKQYSAGYAPIGRAPVSGNYGMQPYQQGLNPQQQQQGLNRLQQGMGMAQQSYKNMGQMANTFGQNAQNAGNAAYNPAIGQYQQALNQNSMNIGSQLASQRGTSVNPGLAARNIGQAGATAAQNAAGQMSSQVAEYKNANQNMQANAYQGQGQMAGMYGNMANAYAQAGLANQGQILNAIAAQNAANMAMQSNVNSSNVAMQSNMNMANVGMQSNINDVMAQQQMAANGLGAGMYNAGLGYNANLYGSSMGYQSTRPPGLFGGQGFLGLFAKGGEVQAPTPADKRAAFVKALKGVPKYANGGRIPEPRRRKMAEGGDPGLGDLGSMGGGEGAGGGGSPFHLMDPKDMQLTSGESAGFPTDPGGSGNGPASMVGKLLMGGLGGMGGQNAFGGGGGGGKGFQDGQTQLASMAMMALLANKGGQVHGGRVPHMAQGGRMRMANGSIVPDMGNPAIMGPGSPNGINPYNGGPPPGQPQMNVAGPVGQPGQVQQGGPGMQNFALAGSPNPQVAMPSTGLPMANAQTKGGGPMPAPGASGGANFIQQQRRPMPGQYAQGGRIPYGRRTGY